MTTETDKYGIGPEHRAAWKAQYGRVYKCGVQAEDEHCYLRRPTRLEIKQTQDLTKDSDAWAFTEALIPKIWLGGSDRFKQGAQEWELLRAVDTKLGQILKPLDAELKEL